MSSASDSDDAFVLPRGYDPDRRMTLDEELAREARAMARFLDFDGDKLPTWKATPSYDGVDTWSQASIGRLNSLRIPKTSRSPVPDLGLYSLGNPERLDPGFASMSTKFARGDGHIFLSNASGTGKTRLVAETLLQHWGLYLTCSAGSVLNTYGSTDLPKLLISLKPDLIGGPRLAEPIQLTTRASLSRAGAARLSSNRTLTRSAFESLVLARLLILKEFRALCAQRGVSDELARRKWTILQLRPLEVIDTDPFYNIFDAVQELDPAEIRQRLTAVLGDDRTQVSHVVVDQAHVSLTMFRHAFVARDDATKTYRHAPVLHEIVRCLADCLPASTLVISSSQEDTRLVSDALLASGAANKDIRHFYALRTLNSLAACTSYIRHFFADEVSDEDCRTAYAWTRGRFKFISLLVTYTLLFGAQNFVPSLHAMLFTFGSYEHPGAVSLHRHFDFKRDPVLPVRFSDLDDSPVRMDMRTAVMAFSLQRVQVPPMDGTATVSIGAALYEQSQDLRCTARVFEPLILLRLAHWVRTSAQGGLHGVIRHKLEDDAFDIQAASFLYGLPSAIWDALASDRDALDGWLDFPGLRPTWTRHSASIVLPRFRQRRRPFLPLQDPPTSLFRIVDTPADVLDWLDHADKPFLIPDEDFGAELLFMLHLHGGAQVLVLVHTRFSETKRARRDSRVVPTRPDELYKNSPDNHRKLMDMLAKLPPLPLGSRKRARGSDTTKERYAQLPLLRLLCFAQPWRVDEAYDPPVASLNFRRMLQLPPPEEIKLADVEKRILDSV
ncbi:hypothetical protein EXIGLDRAFT_830423 [Exidia glandulosa HHB12029]|uniref:Uncharacterized protein n=1 Tax=Exidia glandulosa HHB12029 TaxID=1314781 RepID=A0A165NP28_EXIGL|nr:hypothetical protein EXIGLDRAFT_830423 [Exidia glandulosa HHB12029]